MRTPCSLALLATLVLLPATARAQQWAGPLFSSPVSQPRVDLVVGGMRGTGFGGTVAVRPLSTTPGLRVRLGVGDGPGTRTADGYLRDNAAAAYTAGVDYEAPLKRSETGPLRVSLVSGLGMGVAGSRGAMVSAPLGLSIGYAGDRIRPYIAPRAQLEYRFGDSRYTNSAGRFIPGGRTGGFIAAVDWGVDILLPRGRVLRAAVTTGGTGGGGIGISF